MTFRISDGIDMPEPKYKVIPPADRAIKPKQDFGWFEEHVRELGSGHEFKPEESHE